MPTTGQLERAYSGAYRPAAGRFSWVGDRLLSATRSTLATRIDAIAPGGRILDVGSGDGTLLDALEATGREAYGLERDAKRSNVSEGSIQELDGEWAAIVFWHSLEHLSDPGASLRRAHELLAEGGVLVVALPNASSLQASLFGARWFAVDYPRHLVHVPSRTLLKTVEDLGMQLTRVSSWRGGQVVFGWLHGLVGLAPGRPNLYDAIRRTEARFKPVDRRTRLATLGLAVVLLPLAALCAAAEIMTRRGGTIYLEAKHARH